MWTRLSWDLLAYANVASPYFLGVGSQPARPLVLMMQIAVRLDITFMDLDLMITVSVQVAEWKMPTPLTFHSTYDRETESLPLGIQVNPWGAICEIPGTSETCTAAARRKNGKFPSPPLLSARKFGVVRKLHAKERTPKSNQGAGERHPIRHNHLCWIKS